MSEKGPLEFEFSVTGDKELQASIRKIADSLKGMETELDKSKRLTDDLTSAQGKAAKSAVDLSRNNQSVKAGTEQTTASVGRYKEVISQAAGAMGRMSSSGGVLIQSVSQLAGAFQVFEAGLGPVGVAIALASAAMGVLSVVTNDAKESVDGLEESTAKAAKTLSDYISQIENINSKAELQATVSQGRGTLAQQQGYLAQVTQGMTEADIRAAAAGDRAVMNLSGQMVQGPESAAAQAFRFVREAEARGGKSAEQAAEAARGASSAASAAVEAARRASEQAHSALNGIAAMFDRLATEGQRQLDLDREGYMRRSYVESNVTGDVLSGRAFGKDISRLGKKEQFVTSGPDKPTQRQQDQAAAVLKTADAYDILGDSISSAVGLTEQLAEAAINGEKITAEAVLRGAGQALKGIGEKMFGMGLAHFLAGQAEVSLGNLAASDAIAVGLTEMGIGAGLAAGGLGAMAIAGKPGGGSGGRGRGGGSSARPPRDNANNSGDQGSKTIVINWNQPAILAGTYADAGRLVARTLRDAGTRYGGRI